MDGKQVKTALVIMAAGIGSRFGQGIKQLTRFGPGGEIIMDYSIYDAVAAGFDKIVFVIRKDLEKDFKEIIGDRIAEHVPVEYAFQELSDLPEGFELPKGRTKPWGTGQAILACRDAVSEPFCVINADDYYGKKAFKLIHDELVRQTLESSSDGTAHQVCMAGFILKNTLSENGGVTRGICSVDEEGSLQGIEETKNVIAHEGGAAVLFEDGTMKKVNPASLVSMNMWGFAPEFIDYLAEGFGKFLAQHIGSADEMKAEYLLPTIVDELLKKGEAKVRILPTDDRWFGVTYQEDVPSVKESFKKLAEEGAYPEKLWG